MSFRIVAAVDLSEYADTVLEHAFDQANRHEASEMHVLSVLEPAPRFRRPSKTAEEAARTLRIELAGLVARALETFAKSSVSWRVRLHVRAGRPAEEIASLTGEVEADLVVVGRFGTHRRRGSVADDVTRMAPASVLVVQLKDFDAEESFKQCPACVTSRRESAGDRWFCDEHHRQHSLTASVLLPHEHWGLGDGLRW